MRLVVADFRARRRAGVALAGFALGIGVMTFRAGAAQATVIVNSTADVVADEGFCTLREAATAVNTQAASGATPGECAAGDAGSTSVIFALPAGSTIALLAGSPIVFERSVWVWGPGMDELTLTLGAGSSRLLVFDGRIAGGNFSLSGVTLAYGEGTIPFDLN